VILFHIAPGSNGPDFGGWDLLSAITKRFPVYSAWIGDCIDHGCIGGSYGSQTPKVETAEIAARVLSGERADDIPVLNDHNLQAAVDWRELHRWHIPESALPSDSLVLYRQPTLWERDSKYIIPAIALIIVQAILIAALLWQRARKRKAEAVLRESEERFRVMADTTPSMVWMCDEQGKITYLNERWLVFTGPELNAGYGDTWINMIHPEDLKNVLEDFWQALKNRQSFSREYRLHRNDGTYRWMFDVASSRVNGDGSFAGFIGSAIDVTDQKLAQQALEQVSGQLIEAQEKERTRIARDLHDDICQRLALLSMELEQASATRRDESQRRRTWKKSASTAPKSRATFNRSRTSCTPRNSTTWV
jgi:PAS domain S-box-containing protein